MPIAPAIPRLPIQMQARAILTDPELAGRASASLRRLAWMVEATARGTTPRQAHRPANAIRCAQ